MHCYASKYTCIVRFTSMAESRYATALAELEFDTLEAVLWSAISGGAQLQPARSSALETTSRQKFTLDRY